MAADEHVLRVRMNETGRLTMPIEIRRQLGVEGETEFEVEVDTAQDALVLRPSVLLRREDAWAYTASHRKLLRRGHEDSRQGRVRSLTEKDLKELAE